jgi:hypothetical protein
MQYSTNYNRRIDTPIFAPSRLVPAADLNDGSLKVEMTNWNDLRPGTDIIIERLERNFRVESALEEANSLG